MRRRLCPCRCSRRVRRRRRVQVNFGQHVVLTGSSPELGEWDLGRSPRMEWSEGRNGEHHWSATVELPAGADVEYKFVIDDPKQ